jgi:hypothetical protein
MRKIFSDFLKEDVNRWVENCVTLILYTFPAMVNWYNITSNTVNYLRHMILNNDSLSEVN